MHGLTVREHYNPQVAAVHLGDGRPSPDASVLLNLLTKGMIDHLLYPLQPNHGPIRPLAHRMEIARVFHAR